ITRVCPKTGKPIPPQRKFRWALWFFPFIGVISLIWFLIRVIPKPSRAIYPCQRLAAPVASSFVAWVLGVLGSVVAFHKARRLLRRSRYAVAGLALAVGLVTAYVAMSNLPSQWAQAVTEKQRDPANQPIGSPRGLNPGRVVWVHDTDATDWDGVTAGQTQGYWNNHTDQAVVNEMVSGAICNLAGETDIADAWDSLIRHFNQAKGKGNVGYTTGEKVVIKINLVTTILGMNLDGSGNQIADQQYVSTSPEMVIVLLDQLVNVVGVAKSDITIGDTVAAMPNQLYNRIIAAGFNGVVCLSNPALTGRVKDTFSTTKIHWSDPADTGHENSIPNGYAQADYYINMAILKTHARAAVTVCSKNMFGSMLRTPDQGGNYNLHNTLPYLVPDMGEYRGLVDLMGHQKFGGNGLLFIVDALWCGYDWNQISPPLRWQCQPFNNDWASSILVSQDIVAIDSVAYDIWWAESEVTELPGMYGTPGDPSLWANPRMSGGDDFLHEAALANNPVSGAFYDPEGDGSRLQSLGVHEHCSDNWNYVGPAGGGIDLVKLFFDGEPPATPVITAIMINNKPGMTVSMVEPTNAGVETIKITFDRAMNITADDVVIQKTTFPGGVETPGDIVAITGFTGGGTTAITITINSVQNTWLKVTLTGVTDLSGTALDGEGVGSGRGYIYDAELDLPSGDGTPGGGAVFYVGSLIGDIDCDGAVNIFDWSIFQPNYGTPSGATAEQGDLNGDGAVNIFDFSLFQPNYGHALDPLP
ncbi:MAG: DUF362 domain-containing protein, partial [Planctomycetes bacterium]|nr:DUF362 domain-containing protein [Planctomycetota bacterium]